MKNPFARKTEPPTDVSEASGAPPGEEPQSDQDALPGTAGYEHGVKGTPHPSLRFSFRRPDANADEASPPERDAAGP